MMEAIARLYASCRCACDGLKFAAHSQRNLRIHLVAAAIVLAAGFLLHFSRIEMVLLVVTVTLVITAELLNTSLELTWNLLEARNHPSARAAKDVAAGAVLLATFGSVGVGILLFGPRLLGFLKCHP